MSSGWYIHLSYRYLSAFPIVPGQIQGGVMSMSWPFALAVAWLGLGLVRS